MLPFIARKLICPLHESLLGRRTFQYTRELEDTQWASPDDLRAMQRAKLSALLRHAQANICFYRERLAAGRVDVGTGDPFDALAALPLLDKATIRASIDRMLWPGAPGGLFRSSTGGSTGEPLTFYFDRRRQGYDQAARIRSHRWFGVDVGDRELYLWGSPLEVNRTDTVKRLRDAFFNHRLVSAFNMSPEQMDEYLDTWNRFRPASLFGYPSSIALLAEHARSRGRRLDTRRLRAVFVSGEVCFPHQREAIRACFGAPIADGYGSREAGFIAHQCPEGNMHLTAENLVVEIVDARGKPVPRSESGEIVVTHLDAYAMPLIRYRTGDVGRLRPGRCRCGRGLPMMDVVEGRTTDFLYLPDGNIKHALCIIYPLREIPGIRQFRIVQNADYSVAAEVVPDDTDRRLTPEEVARRVRPVIGERIGLSVRFVPMIECPDSGKHRYVISHAGADVPRARREAAAHA